MCAGAQAAIAADQTQPDVVVLEFAAAGVIPALSFCTSLVVFLIGLKSGHRPVHGAGR